VRCVRDMRDLPPEAYRLDTDGRKWKTLCKERRTVAMQLASYADADGSNIWVGIDTLTTALGMPRATLFRFLDDLKTLCALSSYGLSRYHGTKKRRLHPNNLELNLYLRKRAEDPKYRAFVAALTEAVKKIGPLTLAVPKETPDE
jgi:hypothetical protein